MYVYVYVRVYNYMHVCKVIDLMQKVYHWLSIYYIYYAGIMQVRRIIYL